MPKFTALARRRISWVTWSGSTPNTWEAVTCGCPPRYGRRRSCARPRPCEPAAAARSGSSRRPPAPSPARHKHLPQLGPQLGAHGDVLQVGLGGGEPPGGGDRVLKGGVDAPVRGDHLAQPVHIGGLQLGQLAVLQNFLNDRVAAPELLQHVGVGGVAGFGLLRWFRPGSGRSASIWPKWTRAWSSTSIPARSISASTGHRGAQLLIHFCQAQLGQLAGEQVVEPEEEAGVAGHGRPGLGGALLVLPGLGSQVVLGRGKSASKYCRPTLSSS